MYRHTTASPLEYLAAFAIVFFVAAAGTTVLGKYIDKVRRDAQQA
jgi:hypothetical protein